MQSDLTFLQYTPKRPSSELGGVQNDIFFSVMKVIHRQPERLVAPSDKVARLSCVCRISELMPLVRQLHDDARARYQAQQGEQQQQQAA